MKAEKLANQLNGREHGNELANKEIKEAEENGLVIMVGNSDDRVMVYGFIDTELYGYETFSSYLYKNNFTEYFEGCEDCNLMQLRIKDCIEFKAVNDPEDKDGNILATWLIETDLKHYTFDIMEDGDLYCRGIVFSMEEVKKHYQNKAFDVAEDIVQKLGDRVGFDSIIDNLDHDVLVELTKEIETVIKERYEG
jgi:hypothetical protein